MTNTHRYGNTAAYIVAAIAIMLGLAVSAWLSLPPPPRTAPKGIDSAPEAKDWTNEVDNRRKAVAQVIKKHHA